MNARERFAADISSATDHWELPIIGSDAEKIAVELEERGYSKPRTISTVEELDALADDSVVLDDMDGPLIKVGDWWHSPTDEMRSHSVIVPTTVLYTPKES